MTPMSNLSQSLQMITPLFTELGVLVNIIAKIFHLHTVQSSEEFSLASKLSHYTRNEAYFCMQFLETYNNNENIYTYN